MTLTTDENGYYKFDHLPTYREEGEENYLYGYTVWYLGGVENLAVTKYQMNKGIDDSALPLLPVTISIPLCLDYRYSV